MDSEFCKPRSYKSLSSSETVSIVVKEEANDLEDRQDDIYVQLVESFKNLLSETYLALF